jgi:hypothetical protein
MHWQSKYVPHLRDMAEEQVRKFLESVEMQAAIDEARTVTSRVPLDKSVIERMELARLLRDIGGKPL